MLTGDWEHPYRTMTFDYEAGILREFGRFVERGAVFQGTKPVYWCDTCRTALAEAEAGTAPVTALHVALWLALPAVASSPTMNHPKAVCGASSHDCTSATMPGVEPHV